VSDNIDQIDATISSATANGSGSGFLAADAGAAQSTLVTLNVVADRLAFSAIPGVDVAVGATFDVTIEAQDVAGNIDVDDNATNITISLNSGTGNLTGANTGILTTGTVTISTLTFDASSAITLIAADDAVTLSSGISASINIVLPSATSTLAANATVNEAIVILDVLVNVASGIAVLDFDYLDDGGVGGDIFDTRISQIVISDGGLGTPVDDDWGLVIVGAELTDVVNTVSGTINTNDITFSAIPTGSGLLGEILDNATKTYTLNIWFRNDMLSNAVIVDQEDFTFVVDNSSFTLAAGSSTLTPAQSQSTGANTIDVLATQVVISDINGVTTANIANAAIGVNTAFTMDVEARDANDNLDRGYAETIDITTPTIPGGAILTLAD